MYLPEYFKEEDCAELAALMQRYPLATLIAAGDDGELEVNHIPLEYAHADGQYGVLRGHIAKANPLAQLLEKPRSVYAVFHADQAYISPNGYPSKLADHRAVPTWNYRAVHVKGQIRCVADEKYLRGILARLTRQHEAQQPVPWKMGDAPEDFMRDQLSKIAAVEIEIISMVGKFKVSQNRTKPDAEGVAKALEQSCPEMSQSIRRHFPEQ